MSNQSKMITGSIDLDKIDKDRIQIGKNGHRYLNLVMWLNDQPDNYGNHLSIQQGVTQQERNAGVKAHYIGNGKVFERQQKQGQMPKSKEFNNSTADDTEDGLPF
jgi:hypothetical protein